MNQVWIAKGHWKYEGYNILGVFASEALAKAEIDSTDAQDMFDFVTVSPYEVKKK